MPRKKVGRKIDVNGTLQDLGNTLSDADLEKFDTIERNAQKNVQADWNETDTSSSSYIRNKPSYDSWILGEFEKTSNLYFTPINSNSINLDFINNDLYRAGKLEDSYTMSMTLGKKYTLSFDAYLLDYADASTLWANVKLDNISIQKQGISSGYYKLNTQNYTIGIGASNYTHISFTFTAPINVEDVTTSSLYFGFNKYSGSNIVGYPDKGLIVYIKNVMLNEGETALSYSIPFGQLLWTRDVVGVYAKEEDVPDESKLGSQLSLSLNQSDYKLTVKLLNSSDVVLSSKVVDLPLEEMVVDASYDSTTKEITLELKNGNTTSFSVADLVSGLATQSALNTTNANLTNLTSRVGANETDITNLKNNKANASDLNNYLPKAGGDVTGHIYLTGSKSASSTGNTSQLVFGTSSTNHVALSSNDKALVINPTTSTTTNQIVLYLDKASQFPKGITSSGTINANSIIEGGTSLVNKYLGKTAKASDSSKLNGQEASYYLNYNNLSNKPSIPTGTIPTKTSQLTNDSGFVTSSGSVNYATTSGGAAYLMQEDTRSENYIPAHYITYKYHSAILEFKSGATIGLGNTTFAVLQTFTPWSDSSGGRPHQLAFSDGGSVYHRMATSDSAWGTWERYINANWGYSGSSGYGSLSTSESTILTISSNTSGRFYSVSFNTYSSSSVGADIFVRYGSTSGTAIGGNTTASSGTPSSSAVVSQIQMSTNARHNTKTLCFFVPPNTTAYVRGKSSSSINYTYYYTYAGF